MKKQFILLIIIGLLFSCSRDDENYSKSINMRLNHYQSTGFGEGLFLTLLVQKNNNIGSNIWNKFYGSIEGFDYKPGFIYDLKVLEEGVPNPPADGSSIKYTLQEVKSVQTVTIETQFQIDLKINGQIFVTTSSGYELLNQIKIECNNLCNTLDEKLINQDFVVGTFKRLTDSKIQLIKVE